MGLFLLLDDIGGGGGVDRPLISELDITFPSDAGNDGVIIVSVIGGVPPYEYSIGESFQSENTFTALAEGTYTITVRDSAFYASSISGIKLVKPQTGTGIASGGGVVEIIKEVERQRVKVKVDNITVGDDGQSLREVRVVVNR
jgi:hypothetical protein